MEEFLNKLKSLKNDRGALAKLRRGGNGSIAILADVLPFDWKIKWYLLIAECWAENPKSDDELAFVCKSICLNEKRFMDLLSSDRDELQQRLKSVLRIVASKGRGINWQKLLNDILFWGEKTQQQWAKDFWGNRKGESNE